MPKVINTRKQRAIELFELVKCGPALVPHIGPFTVEEAERRYKNLESLIPELRKMDKMELTDFKTK